MFDTVIDAFFNNPTLQTALELVTAVLQTDVNKRCSDLYPTLVSTICNKCNVVFKKTDKLAINRLVVKDAIKTMVPELERVFGPGAHPRLEVDGLDGLTAALEKILRK